MSEINVENAIVLAETQHNADVPLSDTNDWPYEYLAVPWDAKNAEGPHGFFHVPASDPNGPFIQVSQETFDYFFVTVAKEVGFTKASGWFTVWCQLQLNGLFYKDLHRTSADGRPTFYANSVTKKELAEMLSVSEATINRYLAGMTEWGLVIPEHRSTYEDVARNRVERRQGGNGYYPCLIRRPKEQVHFVGLDEVAESVEVDSEPEVATTMDVAQQATGDHDEPGQHVTAASNPTPLNRGQHVTAVTPAGQHSDVNTSHVTRSLSFITEINTDRRAEPGSSKNEQQRGVVRRGTITDAQLKLLQGRLTRELAAAACSKFKVGGLEGLSKPDASSLIEMVKGQNKPLQEEINSIARKDAHEREERKRLEAKEKQEQEEAEYKADAEAADAKYHKFYGRLLTASEMSTLHLINARQSLQAKYAELHSRIQQAEEADLSCEERLAVLDDVMKEYKAK